MEVYAAQIDRMDQGIGRILAALEKTGQLDDTLVIFLADNGACAEDIPQDVTIDELVDKLMIARRTTRSGEPVHFGNDILRMPGPENTYQSYGTAWANLSNSPFRLYKHWIHEGGISTPLIAHWPNGIAEKGGLRHAPGYLPDIMATIIDAAGASYPAEFEGRRIEPLEGQTLLPVFAQDGIERKPMFWEHEGNAAVRIGRWKLVKRYPRDWELYDLDADRTELHDLAAQQPERVADMARAVRRLGGALRRDPAREDRRPHEQPGGDAGVLGEGRVAHGPRRCKRSDRRARGAPERGARLPQRAKKIGIRLHALSRTGTYAALQQDLPEGGDVGGSVVRQVQAVEEGPFGRVFATAVECGARRPAGRRDRPGRAGARAACAGRPARAAAERGRPGPRRGLTRLSAAPPPWRRAR